MKSKNFSLPIYYLSCFFAVILFYGLGKAQAGENVRECFNTDWPVKSNDLEVDSSLHHGKLANGFRYILKENQEPKNRVAVFLLVNAGSLNETEEQRGVAHFLEHMMFKGTENFPAGTLVEYFQSIGMNFGSDANAHTTYDETVYHIILPNGSERQLDTGFFVMADYARRATLDDTQIDKEREVVLSEKRARDSAAYRTHVASGEFAFRGTKLATRKPIGDEFVLRTADSTLLKSFYNEWYRPENMVLVVVGDMDVQLADQLVQKHFGTLSSSGGKPECPDFGAIIHRGHESYYRFEPELGKTTVSIESFWDIPFQEDSSQLQKREIIRLMGTMITGYRLQRLQEVKDSPLSHASYYSGDIIDRIGYGSISAQTNRDKWQECLVIMEQFLRKAILFGFNDQEVARAKKEILANLQANVLTAKTEDSRAIAKKILQHIHSNRVYQSADQEMSLFAPMLESISVEDVNKAFAALWSNDSRMIAIMGDAQLGVEGKDKILDIYQQSTREEVVAEAGKDREVFPYLALLEAPLGPPKRIRFSDIDVEKLSFANGLTVNLKKTDFQKNSVQLVANFGNGEQSEPAPGMAMITEDIINASGTGKYPQSVIDSILAGSSVDLRFRIGETAFSWVGSSLNKDVEFLVQLLHAVLYDQGFRENQFGNVMSKTERMYQKIGREIDGAMALNVQPFLAGYNPHFGLPPWHTVAKLEYARVAAWVQTFKEPKDLEISVVGDFDVDQMIAILSRYLGGREFEEHQTPETPLVGFPSGDKLTVKVNSSIDKSLVVVAWPTDDFWEIKRTRRLVMLASIFEDKVRKAIREVLGATYSPRVTNFNSRVYRGYGYIISQLIVKPGDEEKIIEAVIKIGDDLSRNGVTYDELIRARKPMATSLADTVRTNKYWLSSVLSLSSRYPQQMDWPSTLISDYGQIDEQELSQFASKYLKKSSVAIAKAVPVGIGEHEE